MKKLALTLENLQVESFETTAGLAGRAGTVFGNSGPAVPNDSEAECGTNTDGPTCGPENTCGYYYDTCQETYVYSCYPCDASNWCNTDVGDTCDGWC
jgi:hypothetical protein